MKIDSLQPPKGFKPLPSIVSETTDRFRWPLERQRAIPIIPEDRTSVGASCESTLPGPRLNYHKKSTYTDDYVQFPFVPNEIFDDGGGWKQPIGKHGRFEGPSCYERDFIWPSISDDKLIPRPAATVGLGIIPILGTGGDVPTTEQTAPTRKESAESITSGSKPEEKDKSSISLRNSYWLRNCDPFKKAELIWKGESTHRHDYVIHPIYQTQTAAKPSHHFNLKFSGNMETTSTVMRDYVDYVALKGGNQGGNLTHKGCEDCNDKFQKCQKDCDDINSEANKSQISIHIDAVALSEK